MSMPTGEITHIELRRVQNGFVVMALNIDVREHNYAGIVQPQRACFIAKDIAEVSTILENIVNGAELKWLPTVDLPILEMRNREFSQATQTQSPPPAEPMTATETRLRHLRHLEQVGSQAPTKITY